MSYFDPNALAQANGYQHGRIEGERAGFCKGQEQGYAAGHADGHALGYDKGWNDCVQVANGEMSKQNKFTQQHISEKKLLKKQYDEQSLLIQQLADKLNQMELKNAELKESKNGLHNVIHALLTKEKRLHSHTS